MIPFAPGWPGSPARWTSSAKDGVGTALSDISQVWFTLSHGIFNEIYYRRIDHASTRDMGMLVTDGAQFFSEEKRHASHAVDYLFDGVPVYRMTSHCTRQRYRIEKTIYSDPRRDVVLQQTRFHPLRGTLDDYHLYVLLAPHLGNMGAGNTAWVGDVKGRPMLLAERDNFALALACSTGWLRRSVGFVGVSDGWQDLLSHKQLTTCYACAENGNVALIGEVDLRACNGEFLLALAFSHKALEAGHLALTSLLDGSQAILDAYVEPWQAWQRTLLHLEPPRQTRNVYRVSTLVLRTHRAKVFSGGVIASLSVPWGFAKGDNDLGGYHLVWTRDLVEAISGLMAAGAEHDVLEALAFLYVTQEADGHWTQNMWLDGTPYWTGVQLDQVGAPILLIGFALRDGMLNLSELPKYAPMLIRAASYLVANGPVTMQDRWEENAGYSPFTLAMAVVALLVAADLAEQMRQPARAAYLRETADCWNALIEHWTYAEDTPLAREHGVAGYYLRIAPPGVEATGANTIELQNRPPGERTLRADQVVSCDALALVRMGLRAPDDPRILNTLTVIDALLKQETPHGPSWHRYNGDGYGEHADGAPYDGTGIGRLWPLLVGERAHYELAANHRAEAERLCAAMEAFANDGGMLPEQTWDGPEIPRFGLAPGCPSGSAMPLVWAHAEYVKLCRSLREGRIFDQPVHAVRRYLTEKTGSPFVFWRFSHQCREMPAGKALRVEVLAPAHVRWSDDDWQTAREIDTRDTTLGIHLADLPTAHVPAGRTVAFTFYWPQADRWEGRTFTVRVTDDFQPCFHGE